jgi:uncharacterized membrane protein YidH (DUF202 family)
MPETAKDPRVYFAAKRTFLTMHRLIASSIFVSFTIMILKSRLLRLRSLRLSPPRQNRLTAIFSCCLGADWSPGM